MRSTALHTVIAATLTAAFTLMPGTASAPDLDDDVSVDTHGLLAAGSLERLVENTHGDYRDPDIVADFPGGQAYRAGTVNGVLTPGDIYYLATSGSSKPVPAKVWTSPFVYDSERTNPGRLRANLAAHTLTEQILGEEVDVLDLISAKGGGSSAGIMLLLTYLDTWADGGIVGDHTVAGTGVLTDLVNVDAIGEADVKFAAAMAAGADIVFIPIGNTIDPALIDQFDATVHVWQTNNMTVAAGPEIRWQAYQAYGARAADTPGPDVYRISHAGNMLAVLCGTGQQAACDLVDEFQITESADIEALWGADVVAEINALTADQ